jgi:hypothetical protein
MQDTSATENGRGGGCPPRTVRRSCCGHLGKACSHVAQRTQSANTASAEEMIGASKDAFRAPATRCAHRSEHPRCARRGCDCCTGDRNWRCLCQAVVRSIAVCTGKRACVGRAWACGRSPIHVVVLWPAFVALRANVVAGAVDYCTGTRWIDVLVRSRPRSIAAPRHGKEICENAFTAVTALGNHHNGKEAALAVLAYSRKLGPFMVLLHDSTIS